MVQVAVLPVMSIPPWQLKQLYVCPFASLCRPVSTMLVTWRCVLWQSVQQAADSDVSACFAVKPLWSVPLLSVYV